MDSGATDHMTPKSDRFVLYEPCIIRKNVQTVDGTLFEVAGIDSMYVEPIGLSSRVLHISKLFISLVSVQRVAKLDEFRIIFEDTNAILCNKVYGWKIGLAKV